MAMGKHQSAKMMTDDWVTPPHIIQELGDFDLDPCAPTNRPWDTASKHFTKKEDGLKQKWHGRVWCNPPYGKETGEWLSRLADHGNGIALIFARTETRLFFEQVWNKATAVMFLEGRLHFHHVNGERSTENAGAPSVLIAYGLGNLIALEESGLDGKLIGLVEYNRVSQLRKKEPTMTRPVTIFKYNGKGKREEIGKGVFHRFGDSYVEFTDGVGNYTTAVVEMPDGEVITPEADMITFNDV